MSPALWEIPSKPCGAAPDWINHCWVSLLRRRAASLCLVSFTEDARPLGGCGWGRVGKPELLTPLGWPEVGEVVGLDAPCRLGILMPFSELSLPRLLSPWLLTTAAEVRLPWLREHGDNGKLPLSFLSSRSCSLAWLKASVSSKRSSHSLRTVSWRKVFWNENKAGRGEAYLALNSLHMDSSWHYKLRTELGIRALCSLIIHEHSTTWTEKSKTWMICEAGKNLREHSIQSLQFAEEEPRVRVTQVEVVQLGLEPSTSCLPQWDFNFSAPCVSDTKSCPCDV